MTNANKFQYAFRLTAVASSCLAFIEHALFTTMRDRIDIAYLRVFYMFLGYACELTLKSRVVMFEDIADEDAVVKRLQNLNHGIYGLGKCLGPSNLSRLGINGIEQRGDKAVITTLDQKDIEIFNSVAIRYDFLRGVIRTVDEQEHIRLKECVGVLSQILVSAKKANEEDKEE